MLVDEDKIVLIDPSFYEGEDHQLYPGVHMQEYLAPEVYKNRCACTPASDMYSLGLVLYSVISGIVEYCFLFDLFVLDAHNNSLQGLDRHTLKRWQVA
jgi:serine/threonine protein kinase